MYHHYTVAPQKKARKRGFFTKLGGAALGFLAGVAGIVAYPVALTASGAVKGARESNNNPYNLFPLRLIKGTWGFARGAVKGFVRGGMQGIAAPFYLSYYGWTKGARKLRRKLLAEKNEAIDDARGHPRGQPIQTDELDYKPDPALPPPGDYELKFDISKKILRDEQPAHKPSASVFHHFPVATTIMQPSSTTAPITITLTSNYPIPPPLSAEDIAKINALLNPSENGTFSVQNNFASFRGPNPTAALAVCQHLAAFSTLQGGYALTFENNIATKKAREYLRTCNNMGIWITDCQIGKKTYQVAPPDTLTLPLSPKLTS